MPLNSAEGVAEYVELHNGCFLLTPERPRRPDLPSLPGLRPNRVVEFFRALSKLLRVQYEGVKEFEDIFVATSYNARSAEDVVSSVHGDPCAPLDQST